MNSEVNWETPAGRVLKELCLSIFTPAIITVFGSAPLQMCIEPGLLSQDVDVFADIDLEEIVRKAGLGIGQRAVGIQVGHELNFRASPLWLGRATTQQIGSCRVIFPHPTDILIGKLHRLEPKDIEAFRVVIQKTGHPTEQEMITELQKAVDHFRPGFDEEQRSDLQVTTAVLWKEIYGRTIDVRQEIIVPALETRRKGYGHDQPEVDHLSQLRKIAGNE